MIIDLHTHTCDSHDGFTTSDELLFACKSIGIKAIAVTEHDKLSKIDASKFSNHGIEFIPGCEFTAESGAHIIGIFIDSTIPSGSRSIDIINHIHNRGGLAIMPHPWKKGSGFMDRNEPLKLIKKFDFIELINGGWDSKVYAKKIYEMSREYGITLISSSDSHKIHQVGLCCTKIKTYDATKSLYENIANLKQHSCELLVDLNLLKKVGRKPNILQQLSLYQSLIKYIPISIKRLVKQFHYEWISNKKIIKPSYKTVNEKSFQW